ncbi:MAG: helix-turn-helix transcriptional regulator, partial [Thermomicrobiales bacterium]
LAHATEPRQPLALIAAHRLLGALETDAGHTEDATAHLRESLALADACEAPYERALTLLAEAELRLATREHAEARSLVDEVRAICTPLGAKPALARVDALAARLPAVQSATPAYPDGLTKREVEVLRLLAGGSTNQEMADALFLSARTIERHITGLYRKIDARGRADATTYALRHHLLTTD